ncbi:MAG: protein jag [Actinomycetaceae bacterium]
MTDDLTTDDESTTPVAGTDDVTGAEPAPEAPSTGEETSTTTSGDGTSSAKVTRLEEEGDVAADYLEELLDIADLDGDIDIEVDHGRASVSIVSEEDGDRYLGRLVGEDGKVLDAVQELTRLAVQAKLGDRSRIMVDIAGYRDRRRSTLTALAEEAIERVRSSGEDVALDPMNPFERKVVHDAVSAAGLVSDSEGVEPRRHVVIRTA